MLFFFLQRTPMLFFFLGTPVFENSIGVLLVFGHADAGMLILGAHDVIHMMCLEKGGEFFVENLGTLIRA
jgi:hypothetical protein